MIEKIVFIMLINTSKCQPPVWTKSLNFAHSTMNPWFSSPSIIWCCPLSYSGSPLIKSFMTLKDSKGCWIPRAMLLNFMPSKILKWICVTNAASWRKWMISLGLGLGKKYISSKLFFYFELIYLILVKYIILYSIRQW